VVRRCASRRARARSLVAAGLAVSGVYDVAPIRDTWLNVALKLTDEEIARFSPLGLPIVQKRLTIAYGSAELPALVWDSKNFFDAREAVGAPGELVVIEGADHFTILEELRRADGALAKLALSLVAERG
jgi:arylformamidase